MPVYDDEDWLPSTAEQAAGGGEEDDTDQDPEEKRQRVSQTVLKDLGNKYTGDEMDLIAKTATHGYYLRSLEQAQSYPGGEFSPKSTDVGQVGPPPPVTTVCPYDIPKPRLPAPPTPKGSTAADYYEALDLRDQEIRKGGHFYQ